MRHFAMTTDEGTPSTNNHLGVKGVGELGTIGAAPAVANAVLDALARAYPGMAVDRLQMPFTAERVWKAMEKTGTLTSTPRSTASGWIRARSSCTSGTLCSGTSTIKGTCRRDVRSEALVPRVGNRGAHHARRPGAESGAEQRGEHDGGHVPVLVGDHRVDEQQSARASQRRADQCAPLEAVDDVGRMQDVCLVQARPSGRPPVR
jgi:hypothetical protein